MLTSEPPRSPWDLNFSVAGIPVRVHPMFWVVSVLLGIGGTDGEPTLLLIWVIAVFASILVHELGHAIAVKANGWQPWITLHGFGGLASYHPTHHRPTTQIAISLAGPAAGFALAAAVVLVLRVGGFGVRFAVAGETLIHWSIDRRLDQQSPLLVDLTNYLLYINIYWGLFNLLPILPLDGGHVAQELLTLGGRRDAIRLSLIVSIVGAAAIAAYALLELKQTYLGIFFGYLAYVNYTTFQGYFGGGGWR